MSRQATDQRPLFAAWLPWEHFPEPVRQQALEALATLYLETLDLSHRETDSQDVHDD
jgi:hypothetical protein